MALLLRMNRISLLGFFFQRVTGQILWLVNKVRGSTKMLFYTKRVYRECALKNKNVFLYTGLKAVTAVRAFSGCASLLLASRHLFWSHVTKKLETSATTSSF
jgi:hypothetical protein